MIRKSLLYDLFTGHGKYPTLIWRPARCDQDTSVVYAKNNSFFVNQAGEYDIGLTLEMDTYTKDPKSDVTLMYLCLRHVSKIPKDITNTCSRFRIPRKMTLPIGLTTTISAKDGDRLDITASNVASIYNSEGFNRLIIRQIRAL